MLRQILIGILLAAGPALAQGDASTIIRSLEQMRMQRNAEMRKGQELLDDDKKDFKGLNYFPIDLKYRFTVTLQRIKSAEYLEFATSDGRQRRVRRYGYFDFTVNNVRYRIYVYKILDLEKKLPNYLFLPFADETTDRESYHGGRYLDLTEHENTQYVLDFNLAYNPSCAYGKSGFSCPLAPAENRLPVRLEAGEKKWRH